MQLGMIGLGRMGGSMVRRLLRGGHACVVFDSQPASVAKLVQDGAIGSRSLEEFTAKLDAPRVIWLMVPAAVVETTLDAMAPHLHAGDIVVDGGNSHYIDDIRRAKALEGRGIHYVDTGVSGGVWGTERGYCLMIGGDAASVAHLDPIFRTLAPGVGTAPRTPGADARHSTAEAGYLHCGAAGAGHFVKMVHNGIEYALMAAYAEGFNVLAHANAGTRGAAGGRRDRPAAASRAVSIRSPLAGYRRGVAARKRDRFLAPRSHRARARRASGPAAVLRSRVRLGRRPLDGEGGHRDVHAGARPDCRAVPAVQFPRRR